MHDWESLSHVRWDCKYHVVIVPKYRRRALYGKFRRDVGRILRDLCRQRGVLVPRRNEKWLRGGAHNRISSRYPESYQFRCLLPSQFQSRDRPERRGLERGGPERDYGSSR